MRGEDPHSSGKASGRPEEAGGGHYCPRWKHGLPHSGLMFGPVGLLNEGDPVIHRSAASEVSHVPAARSGEAVPAGGVESLHHIVECE
eukprot:1913158-Pyramimonas_sp.AAC.1